MTDIREAAHDVNDKQKRLIVDRRSLGQIALTKRRLTNNNDDIMSNGTSYLPLKPLQVDGLDYGLENSSIMNRVGQELHVSVSTPGGISLPQIHSHR